MIHAVEHASTRVYMAKRMLEMKTGRQAAYWRRELRRRRELYRRLKALTFYQRYASGPRKNHTYGREP